MESGAKDKVSADANVSFDRCSDKRVLRVMRENNLLSPHRCRRRGGNPHVGEIIMDIHEHWNAEFKRGDRFAALQPISMGLARLYAWDAPMSYGQKLVTA